MNATAPTPLPTTAADRLAEQIARSGKRAGLSHDQLSHLGADTVKPLKPLFAILLAFGLACSGLLAADLTQTAASVVPGSGAVHANGVPGEAFSAGMPVYIKAADGLLYKALNTTAAAASCVGIAEATGVVGQRTFYQIGGQMNLGATLTVGETYVVSATAGKIAPIGDLASTNYVTYLGQAVSASMLNMNIGVTGVQRAALDPLTRQEWLACLNTPFRIGHYERLHYPEKPSELSP